MSDGTISTFQKLKGGSWVAFVEEDALYVSGSDVSWEKFAVVDGEVSDLDLGRSEAAWVHACWLEFSDAKPAEQG